jgi:Kef-type K+ transport system membrane component KefB/nucleotide-binding universal stress UspA family protein
MVLLNVFELTLPLKNPVLIFSLILFIILFAPIILNKFRIPHLIGLIIAGAIIGPHGFSLMLRDSSIILFGTVGLLYIMFLAGLEIDIAEFKKNSGKSLVFGMLTFTIPMTLGTLMGLYYLHFSVPTSVLLASMFASHTLIAYPIVSKLGIVKNRAVNTTVGGTMITDTLALLVLAVIAGMSVGEVNNQFWIRLGISVLIFGATVMLLFPVIGRWFFKNFDDNISQYIFVLAMVFLGAFLAEAAGIEAIIGAFLSGLALNRLIPHTSPLMNRIEFVGNALFIPFFLIGVGMLIDFRAFFKDWQTINVAIAMTVTATLAKYLAAFFTQKIFGYSVDERRIIFGLSNAQAAATLAAVLVGYNIILGEDALGNPIRLLNDAVLNGTILMILFTCTIASFVAQKGAQNIALLENPDSESATKENDERILIASNNPDTTEELVHLSITVKSKNNKKGLYTLNVIDEEATANGKEKKARSILQKAVNTAAATDNFMHELIRYDLNVVNGINNVVMEHKITDLILGLDSHKGISHTFFGNLTEGILSKCNTTTLIYKPNQPLSTIKRHIIVVPERAEKEIGFPFWLIKVWNIARNTGAKLIFYGTENTINYIRELNSKFPVESVSVEFSDWNDFLILSRDIKADDNLIVVMSRKDRPSYNTTMPKIPGFLNKYFQDNNFMLIYPMQSGVGEDLVSDLKNPAVLEPLEKLGDIGKTIASIFMRK